ncbi:MAG: hypothetical protein CLLPBCKN_006889 [Chroococcidiopsis cubana SAG 39.79]|uniref:Transposase IS4-like domain-containing protein n=1 Tax=Chroococcidiopsis cubana SAG 39.79 TaxID=388085 RepID=A0AB37UIP1_9CYAN|nr:hypothetical protein [Chroococcidiopsis cubana]MDZ4877454.1 hypothetical protein [Chroococcidiopsis cubana SAG 39.79]PSB55536.1 hypothetical protein C7B79_33440 [Chroococcidiopsis cubana CCALA 043]RUT11209.1 hypothetical protein DSM107010_34780 [Chroococcidiopsis cubana SAG 39.79]
MGASIVESNAEFVTRQITILLGKTFLETEETAKSDTTLETMAQIAGQRWRIEECFKLAKDSVRFRGI